LNQGNQASLVVNQQNYGVVFVQAVVGSVAHDEILSRWVSGVVQHEHRLGFAMRQKKRVKSV
jgi:hypothetical protein